MPKHEKPPAIEKKIRFKDLPTNTVFRKGFNYFQKKENGVSQIVRGQRQIAKETILSDDSRAGLLYGSEAEYIECKPPNENTSVFKSSLQKAIKALSD